MPLFRLTFAVVLSALALSAWGNLRAATPIMPIANVRPGMSGVGRTVFAGTRVEEFGVEILGVLENVMAPQRDLIVAKLEGGPLADTGVIAGMSGSPVYVDGQLIGAVSYSLGSFSKEPIAGITPIQEMIDETANNAPRVASARLQLDGPLTHQNLVAAFRRALNWNQSFAARPEDLQVVGAFGVPGLGASEVGMMLRPIATPLVMAGFEPDVARVLGATFREQGFFPTAGAPANTRPGEMPFDGPLKPGDAVGVTFVTGDLLLGGTGTVTHIDGDRVYAFGHPIYNLGPTQFPMTRAYVYTVLPSLFSSAKLTATGETIGTLLQDRATAIAGQLGPGPDLIPVTMHLESERGARRTFEFGVVRDRLFTPLMTHAALLNTLRSYERQFGSATFVVQGSASLGKHGTLSFQNIFSGDSPSDSAAAAVATPLTALLSNRDADVSIESLDLAFSATEDPQIATLERVWIDETRPRAGRITPLKVLLHTFRGEDILETVPMQIPTHVRGRLTVVVADGQRLAQAEQREARISPQTGTVTQLVRDWNRGRRNNSLYVRLVNSEAGAIVSGERLPSLPPSVLAVFRSNVSGESIDPLNTATLGEWEIETGHVVLGTRTLTLSVSPH